MSRERPLALVLGGVLTLSLLAGCSDDTPVDTPAPPVEEVQSEVEQSTETAPLSYVIENEMEGEYELSDLVVEGKDKKLSSYDLEEPILMKIEDDGRVEGKLCNDFSVLMTEDGETSEAISTRMYCEEPEKLMDVENLVLGTFDGTVVKMNDDIVFVGVNGDQSIWASVSDE